MDELISSLFWWYCEFCVYWEFTLTLHIQYISCMNMTCDIYVLTNETHIYIHNKMHNCLESISNSINNSEADLIVIQSLIIGNKIQREW